MATTAQRAHIGALLDMFSAHAAQLGYPPGDRRTAEDAMDWTLTEAQMLTLLKNGHSIQFDCSETDSWIFRCVGLWPYKTSAGFTGTWLQWLLNRYTNPKIAALGAPVIFGIDQEPEGHHMALVRHPDPKHGNPVLGSHGEPGWDEITFEDELGRQQRLGFTGWTFLNITRA
jgi:hypothetical protein